MTRLTYAGLGICVLFSLGCRNDTAKARALLDEASDLVHQDKADEAQKVLNTVVSEYSGSQEAAEATHLLTVLAAQKDDKSEDALRHELLVQVGRFALDCGRYPTEREGLQVLLVNPGVNGWKGPYLDRPWIGRIANFEYRIRDDKPEILSKH